MTGLGVLANNSLAGHSQTDNDDGSKVSFMWPPLVVRGWRLVSGPLVTDDDALKVESSVMFSRPKVRHWKCVS
jgi:hypothetical protein